MTKKQIQKLEATLARLEALQNEISDSEIRYRLGAGKNELKRVLSMAEKDSQS